MHRRRLLTGVATATTLSVAGCAGGVNSDESQESKQNKDTIQRNGQQYFFIEDNGTLGHLAETQPPEDAKDWQVVQSEHTKEASWEELQLNDVERARDFAEVDLRDSVDEIIQNAKQIYLNEDFSFTVPDIINIEDEDDEVTFTRALNKAGEEAGVDSSGLADWVVANIAEYAVRELDVVDFNDYKLSTVPATEEASGRGGHAGGKKPNGKGNSGFRHMPSVLQYVKDGEAKLKYAEVTTPGIAPILGDDAIREPEDSMYREELGQGRLERNGNYPLHFVTCLDYTKARALEAREEDILGVGKQESNTGDIYYTSIGDYIGNFLHQLVDDVFITGYTQDGEEINPDISLSADSGIGYTVVSDAFGESLEEAIVDPTIETREYMENIGRGLYTIRETQGWDTSIALTGTVSDPEIRGTTDTKVEAIREELAYDQVRDRVAG